MGIFSNFFGGTLRKEKKESLKNLKPDKAADLKNLINGFLTAVPNFEMDLLGKMGFDPQISHYLFLVSRNEQNKFILTTIPKNFWNGLGVLQEDILGSADDLCEPEFRTNKEIVAAIHQSTIKGGELNADPEFAKMANFIFHAELQAIGIRLLLSAPASAREDFFEKVRNSKARSNALRMWATLFVADLAKDAALMPEDAAAADFPAKAMQPWMPGIVDLVNHLGFIEAIIFIREASKEIDSQDRVSPYLPSLSFVIEKPFWP